MSNLYSYLFNKGNKKPCETNVGETIKEGFISFNGGESVNWILFDYDGKGGLVPCQSMIIIPHVNIIEQTDEQKAAMLDALKENKKNELKDIRDLKESSGFEYLGKTFDSDSKSINRLTIAILTAQVAIASGVSFSVDWTCQDNTDIKLSAEQLLGIPGTIAMHVDSLHVKYRQICTDHIDIATTVDEVNAIVWD